MNKIFICNEFKGFYPVGVSALIIAPNKKMAYDLLITELKSIGLEQDNLIATDLTEIHNTVKRAYIINDGDY